MRKLQILFAILVCILSVVVSANTGSGAASTDFKSKLTTLKEKTTLKDKIKVETKLPKFRVGDWNSSGAPQMPYEPTYPYEYRCQAQLTDSELHTDGDQTYRFYAITEFNLTNEQSYVESSKLQWIGKKFYSMTEIVDAKVPATFQTGGHAFYLRLTPGSSEDKDLVVVSARLSQKFGNFVFSDDESGEFYRASSGLKLDVSLTVESTQEVPVRPLSLRLICDKIK